MNQELESELRELERRFAIVATGHFETCEFWRMVYYALGLPATLLAALTALSIVRESPRVAAYLAIASTVVTAAVTFLDPRRKEHEHWELGEAYVALRDDAHAALVIPGLDDVSARAKSDALLTRRRELGKRVVHVPKRFHKRAVKLHDEGATEEHARRSNARTRS